ncbi:Trehalase [Trachymyrmex septentrionalis]|uniref:Trehalase n=1 Tax=Trachymyrmex septentrionalis TaxID=34720 RepID=A0A195FVD2_9HYME|nr:PREDICTED: trehalase-like [Trachymyrmex septentrionalis]KYN44386.1 Trehalase [Trachymyrmex septentrionalis]
MIVVLIIFLVIGLNNAASIAHVNRTTYPGPADLCDSQVYCEGPLLRTVQLAGIFNDSKTFVDLYQLHDPNVTVENFNVLMKATSNSPNRTEVAKFVAENFAMRDELDNSTLPDWKENPGILKSIKDLQYRKWAKRLNYIWKTLARKINNDLVVNPQRHSLIYVNNTFIIPGGRFKEFYYWDSYWIIEGLLLCDMHVTVKGMIENFLSMVERYGFIPNGGRVYYLSRSQPPLLIPMVAKYYDYTKDRKFLKKNIAILEREFEYWQNKTVDVRKNGKTYKMAHYVVNSRGPRPESYKEDYQLVQQVPEKERGSIYNDLKAAAESGWDFSYRWCIRTNKNANLSLVNVSTSDIIPVDLNAILQQNARMLARFFVILGNVKKNWHYAQIALEYQAAIDNVLWNEDEGIWLDYDMKNKQSRNIFYPSNLSPLYTMSYDWNKRMKYALRSVFYIKKNKIDSYFGGTPASINYTGEQWDFPNAWPPLQSFLILGLYQTQVKPAIDLAKALADRWLKSNYLGYDEYGKMFEKYNAMHPGEGGGGGEYNVQDGFGWTNGIVFEFLRLFPDAESVDNIKYDSNGIDR